MFNWKKVSLILLASAALLSGCTQSNIVSPADGKIQGDGQPDTEIDKDIKIDWEEVRSDLEEQYLEPYGAFADYVMDLNVVYDDETGLLTVLLPVTRKTTSDVAVVYAQDVLGSIGESVATQNFYYTAPEENENGFTTSYGSFFDDHDVKVQVFPYDKEGDESSYLVNDTHNSTAFCNNLRSFLLVFDILYVNPKIDKSCHFIIFITCSQNICSCFFVNLSPLQCRFFCG